MTVDPQAFPRRSLTGRSSAGAPQGREQVGYHRAGQWHLWTVNRVQPGRVLRLGQRALTEAIYPTTWNSIR